MKHQYGQTLHSFDMLIHPLEKMPDETLPVEKSVVSKHTQGSVHVTSLLSFMHTRHTQAVTHKKQDKKAQVFPPALDVDASHPVEKHPLVAKCMHFIMKKGQKAKAGAVMQLVCQLLQKKTVHTKNPLHAIDMIRGAVHHVKPAFELRKARLRGRTQFIPATMPVYKQENAALRALVLTAKEKQKKSTGAKSHVDMYAFAFFLAQEITEAYANQGAACQAKHSTHKQAEHNRTNVRRRWW